MANLVNAAIDHFKNIIHSEAQISENVTCLVGKNESGKTSFLEALYRVNPARNNEASKIDLQKQYPAWLEKRHRRQGKKLEEAIFAVATFQLSDAELAEVNAKFGQGAFTGNTFDVKVRYDGHRTWWFATNEKASVKHIIDSNGWTEVAKAWPTNTFGEFAAAADGSDQIDAELKEQIKNVLEQRVGKEYKYRDPIFNHLQTITPKFLYFSEFSQLPGTVNIAHVLEADTEKLSDGELTARTLLTMAAAANDYLKDPDYETRKRELENISNDISKEILSYWSTNKTLRMLVDVTQSTKSTNQGQTAVVKEIKFRIWDDAHQLSLGLEGRSSGFRWFFSFLAAFSEYEFTSTPIVILLDEPGLGLHARAQKDFLRFIDERLAPRCRVLFTTHSPFMVQADRLERVKLVEDKGPETGSVISADIMSTDRDTLFPLQGALGYDLVQHLLIAPHNLLVEGSSDHTYLIVMSDWLRDNGRIGLDERFSIVVAGGLDCVPTFVALLGGHLELAVLIDSASKGHQRLESFAKQGLLKKNRVVAVGDVLGKTPADMEDIFAVSDYLKLYNGAFGSKLTVPAKDAKDRIVSRICRAASIDDFNHRKPADYLMRNKATLLDKFAEETMVNFENLFKAVNATLN